MKLGKLKLDLNAVEDGVVFPFEDGATIKIAKWRNAAHEKFLTDVRKQNNVKIQAKMITKEQEDYILAGQWPFIIRDMQGFTDGEEIVDGVVKQIPFVYSPQSIIDLARNPQFKEFFDKVATISLDEENYRIETIKQLGEVLPDLSNGH